MRILLFNNSGLLRSGNDFCIEGATGEFAKELQSFGHEVTFYGQFLSDVENTTDVFPILKNGMFVKGTARKRNKLLNYIALYLGALPQIYKADFIYFFYPTAFRFLIFFAIILRKKYGLYIRGIDDLKKPESKFFYKKSYRIFTVADFFTDYVNQIAGKSLAATIRPMIGFNEDDIVIGRAYNTEILNLKLLYLGRMTDDKGIIELLQAVEILVRNGLKPQFTLVGSGEYLQELMQLARDLNIADYAVFTGAVFDKEQIKKYYLEADVFILPSYHEGFPRTLYEAMIFGTPIITTFVGGISGVMKSGENCQQILPKSVESIVQNITFAQRNYGKMIAMAENATQTIRNIFDARKRSHAQMLDDELKYLRL